MYFYRPTDRCHYSAAVDHDDVARQAVDHSGGAGNSDMFSSAMRHVQGRRVR